MRRVHAFEFNESPWFPAVLRDIITDSLQFGAERMGIYRPALSVLASFIEESGEDRIVDLCSGAGGPLVSMLGELRVRTGRPLSLVLTDRFANHGAVERIEREGDRRVAYHRASVDASNVSRELVGVRTMFTSFHHFAPSEAVAVLSDAVKARAPIAIFEMTERSPTAIAASLGVPLAMWVTTAAIRPVTWSRLLFTYALPVAPIVNAWDGVVSCLRTYTTRELLSLAREADPRATFAWRAERAAPSAIGPTITWLTGMPRR